MVDSIFSWVVLFCGAIAISVYLIKEKIRYDHDRYWASERAWQAQESIWRELN